MSKFLLTPHQAFPNPAPCFSQNEKEFSYFLSWGKCPIFSQFFHRKINGLAYGDWHEVC